MTDERKRQLERIDQINDRLWEMAHRYGRLRNRCHERDAPQTFLNMTEAAGKLTEDACKSPLTFLDALWRAAGKVRNVIKDLT